VIKIDKTDTLYKYLSALQVENIDEVYLELAKNGRFKLNDVRTYLREMFRPSQKDDLDEKELEKVLDYYIDIKKLKHLNTKTLREKLLEYKQLKNDQVKEEIINSQLKDILYLCLNYSTLHKDVDIQDLIQVANIGLLEAIEKFNDKVKLDFKDYVVYYVRKNIKENFEEKTNG